MHATDTIYARSRETIDNHETIAARATDLGGSVCPYCDSAQNVVRAAFRQATRHEPTRFLGYEATCPARCDGPFTLRTYTVEIVSLDPLRITTDRMPA